MQIKKLEEEFNVLIFDRSKKPVIPTEIGHQIIQQARDGLARLNGIYDIIRDEQEGLNGELRVGIIPTLSPYLLPRFAGRFSVKYPGVELLVEEMLTERLVDMLQNDLIDVGILVTPLDATSIREIPLFYEAFYVYHSAEHPLSDRAEVDIADLNLADMWLLRDGHCFKDQVVNICGAQEHQEHKKSFQFQAGSIETLKRIVDRQFGFTLLPELAVRELPPEQRAQVRPFKEPYPLREVSMVTHRSFLKQKLLASFQEEIRAAVPKHMLDPGRGTTVRWRE